MKKNKANKKMKKIVYKITSAEIVLDELLNERDALAKEMKASGMTAVEIGEAMGLTRQMVYKILGK
tara:strand:- start:236 stop:433 length:198 start_codon:yes stop_codon:yes gene_type:complete